MDVVDIKRDAAKANGDNVAEAFADGSDGAWSAGADNTKGLKYTLNAV